MNRELIELYFRDHSLVSQQIASFNKFLDQGIQQVVRHVGKIKTNVEGFEIKLGRIKLKKPRFYEVRGGIRHIYPHEARIRNLTYASPIYLEMTPIYNGIPSKQTEEIYIGELPIMVKSKLCHLHGMSRKELIEAGEDPDDPGGYFIVNGSEKVLISLEDLAANKIMTVVERGQVVSKVFSTRHGFRAKCTVYYSESRKEMIVDFPSVPPIPLIALLRILGLKTDKEILNAFSDRTIIQNEVLLSLERDETKDYNTAIEMLSKKVAPGQAKEFRIKRLKLLLNNYLLPHLGIEEKHYLKKAEYLIRMAERMILVRNKMRKPDDKDHYKNKRVKLAGELMYELFTSAFQYFVRDLVYQVGRAEARKRRVHLQALVREEALTERIKYAMGTGTWVAGQTGVSQLLERTSWLATMSHLRRVVSPIAKKHPHFKIRDLHGTHWGKLCTHETPEGPNCSLVKNLAILAEVSTGVDERPVLHILKELGVKEVGK